VKIFALLFGIIFLMFGIAGFVPGALTDGQLVRVFKVNTWLNVLHLLTGLFAVIVCWMRRPYCRIYFQIIGTLYALIAVLGFIYDDNDLLGLFANNQSDTWFHVIAAIAALVVGYGEADTSSNHRGHQ